MKNAFFGRFQLDAILSLTWKSAYQSVRGLVAHFAPAWSRAGLRLLELDISEAGWEERLKDVLSTHQIRFVLSTSGIGANMKLDGQNIWAKLNLPVFNLLLDHPAYLAANHTAQPGAAVLGYMFRDHALYQASDVRSGNMVTSIDYGVPGFDQPAGSRNTKIRPAARCVRKDRPRAGYLDGILAGSAQARAAAARRARRAGAGAPWLCQCLGLPATDRASGGGAPV